MGDWEKKEAAKKGSSGAVWCVPCLMLAALLIGLGAMAFTCFVGVADVYMNAEQSDAYCHALSQAFCGGSSRIAHPSVQTTWSPH